MPENYAKKGTTYKVPKGTDAIDGPQAFKDFADSIPALLPDPAAETAAGAADSADKGKIATVTPAGGVAWQPNTPLPAATVPADQGKVLTVGTTGGPEWAATAKELPPITAPTDGNKELRVNAGGTAVEWRTPTAHLALAGSTAAEKPKDPGAAAVTGTATTAAHTDHVHRRELPAVGGAANSGKVLSVNAAGSGVEWVEPPHGAPLSDDAPLAPESVEDPGSSTEASRADHVHPAELPIHSPAETGKVLSVDAQGDPEWVDAPSGLPALGTSGQILTVNTGATDVEWADPASGLPPFVAADASKHLAVNAAGAAVGWVDPLALSTTAPANPAATAAVGTGTTAARADHAHVQELPAHAAGNAGQALRVTANGTGVEWANPLALATAAPHDPAAAAAAGTGTTAARDDHVHKKELPTVTAADNDKELQVKAGVWATGRKTTIAAAAPTASDPGTDGDLWFVTA